MYSNILVDCFNLYYREKDKVENTNPILIANHLIDTIENDIRIYQNKDKPLYLLFDPIPLKDLGVDSTFKFQSTRQKIDVNYKANRKKNDDLALDVLELVRKYFSHRGDSYIECLNDKYEADDYVASIIEDIKSSNSIYSIALYTTDEDWARYLEKDIVIINKGFKDPMTVESFYEKYKFIPNVASVQMFKAFFGDPSDNITGVLLHKKLKKFNLAKKLGFKYVQKLGDTGATMADVYKAIHKNTGTEEDKIEKIVTDTEVDFFDSIFCIDPKYDIIEGLMKNLSLIESKCDDYKKSVISKPVDEKYNVFIEQLLNRTKVKKPFRFGKLKT